MQHDIVREVHPDVGEIQAHVVEEQGVKINASAEQVTHVAETVTSPETQATAKPVLNSHPTKSPGKGWRGGVSKVDMDRNNTFQINAIRVVISTFETLPLEG